MRQILLIAFVVTIVSGRSLAATYCVATNGSDVTGTGTAGNPWATIDHADKNGLLNPGDIVIVNAGTYVPTSAQGVFLQVDSGTELNPITYQANGHVVIDQSGYPATSYGLQVVSSGIVINGFEIKGATEGVALNGVSTVEVENCVVHDSTPTDSSGVYVYAGCYNVTIQNNVIYNINAAANSPWGSVGVGVRVSGSDAVKVWNNTMDNCYLGVFYYGSGLGAGPYGHITTYNNIVANSAGWAFVNPWDTDPSYFTNGYNLLYNDTTTYGNFPAGNNGLMNGDVSGNPKFVFPAQHDYHLLAGSPAGTAGTNVGLPFSGAAPNIGAFDGTTPPAQIGTISGVVTANLAGSPVVPGTTVQTQDGSVVTTADVNGNYSLVVVAGSVTLKAGARAMTTQSLDTNVPAGGTATLNFGLVLTTTPTTYYVDNGAGNDGNAGTQASPWKTIGNGDRLGALSPGDTVLVNAGTYSQTSSNGVSLTNSSGYAFAPITYRTDESVVINQSSYTAGSYGFDVTVSGIVLNGFEIIGAQHGIYLAPGSSYCMVDNCLIHDANDMGKDASGVYVKQSANDTLQRNVIYNITDAGDAAWSPAGCGIRNSDAENLKVYNNTIDNCYLGVFYYGASPGGGPYGHITTYNNIVSDCAGWAFVNPWLIDPSYFTNGYNLIYNDATPYSNYPASNKGPLPGDVAENPLFVNGVAHNYQLQNNSPALNAGTYVGLPYVGPGPDIGALESSYIPPVHTYYVNGVTGNDNNPGTAAQPWKTIGNGDAIGILNPGDTVVVNAGTYVPASGSGIQLTNRHGTMIAPLTYTVTNGMAVIDETGISGTSYGFYVGVVGITINGFEIKGAQHGVYLSPASGSCTVNGCVIHDANSMAKEAEGIYADHSSGDTLTRNIIYNVMDATDTPWTPVGCGIRAGDASNLNVWNNTIDTCYLGLYYHGSIPGAAPYGHITTENNIVVNCGGWAFVNPWDGRAADFTSDHNLIYNDTVTFGNYPAGNNVPLLTDVAQNPMFVDGASHNYYLQSGSPAIGQGTNVGLPYSGSASNIGALGSDFIISQLVTQSGTVGEPVAFLANVTSLQPYSLQWLVNGVAIPEATNASYTLPAASFCDNGSTFSVVASNVFGIQTNTGTLLTVIPGDLSLAINVVGSPDRSAQLTLTGQAQKWQDVDTSTNLATWSLLGKFYNTNGSISMDDIIATNHLRFYRARTAPPDPTFSFTYNGVSSTQFLSGWSPNETVVALDSQRVQKTFVYSDPVTGLQVTCQETEYSDYPAEEWTLFFENKGTNDTPILSQVNAADVTLHHGSCGEFNLYYAKGCSAQVNDFEPYQTNLTPGTLMSFAPTGGRSSQDTAFPYYNVVEPEGGGDIMAVGWSGQWAASFARDATTNLNIKAGMQLTHLILHPGEKIRTPSILMLEYVGNRIDGQNLFRQLMAHHYTPTVNGQTVVMPTAASPHSYIDLGSTTEANMVQTITNIAYNHFPVDTYWIDAGWFYYSSIWEYGSGNWYPDPARYPHGMKPVADAAHTNGMKFLLWFDLERVMPNTALFNAHPEWMLSGSVQIGGEPCYLLNFANPAALNWAETNFNTLIHDIGIDVFRHDMNMEPLTYWRGNDAANRQGMTEASYITGLYSFFDYLRSNNPSLLIDNSSAAGHRLDFEMARRSVPLNRSDAEGNPTPDQCMEYALAFWLPYQGLGSPTADSYEFRSGMGEAAVYFFPQFGNPNDPTWAIGTHEINQFKSVRDYYLGDFFPLTQYSTNATDWLAYQFDRPDLNGGVVQAFRREASSVNFKVLPLFGLDPNATYSITNFDIPGVIIMSGLNLMSQGLPVTITTQPGAVVYSYHRMSN
jgi:alpha-galactosidase